MYEFLSGGVGCEVYFVATKSDQARICFANTQMMAKHSEKLQDKLVIRQHYISKKSLLNGAWIDDNKSIMKPLSGEGKTADGLNGSTAIFDESALIEDRTIIDAVSSGMISRDNPLRIYITTAGHNENTVFLSSLTMMRNILDGAVENFHWFGLLYSIDDGDDLYNLDTIRKSNPMVGVTIREDALLNKLEEVKHKPADKAEFLMKHYNSYQKAAHSWLALSEWEAGNVPERPDLSNATIFVGFDLASVRDVNAVCTLYRFPNGRFYSEFQCFLPEGALDHISQIVRPIFDEAIATGSLILTQGKVVDHEQILDFIKAKFPDPEKVKCIGFDPHNASFLHKQLDVFGYTIEAISQSTFSLSQAIKLAEKLICDKKLSHLADPFINFQFTCCELKKLDTKENVRLEKNRDSSKMIDAIVTLVIALKVQMNFDDEEEDCGFFISKRA